jgi:hypothetical protein
MITLASLVPGQQVLVAGITMSLFYWDNDNPVFHHTSNGTQVTYIKRDWNKNTTIKA